MGMAKARMGLDRFALFDRYREWLCQIAAEVDPERGIVIMRTLLPPRWACSNVLAVALNPAPFRSWLAE